MPIFVFLFPEYNEIEQEGSAVRRNLKKGDDKEKKER